MTVPWSFASRMTPSSPRAQQHATRAAFFIPGFATAAWAPMVPYAKAKAGLSDARDRKSVV